MPIYLIYKKEDGNIEYTCDSGNTELDVNLKLGENYETIDKNDYKILQDNGNEYYRLKDKKIVEKTLSEKKYIDDLKIKSNPNTKIDELQAEIEILKKKIK